MAFIKVKGKKGTEAIINTDLICRIAKTKNLLPVSLKNGLKSPDTVNGVLKI